jgi:serine/threonine-protein kinase
MTRAGACERCGAAIMAGARFCATCGADVSDQQGEMATTPLMVAGSSTQQIKRALLDRLRDFTLGEYEILVELGSGGMASVYLAHDIQLDRKVAIKVMHPQLLEGEGMVERFRLEARTVAALSHPQIVPIFAVKSAEDLFLFIMKFIEGQPLDGIIKKQAPLGPEMVRHLLSRVAEALGYAHRQRVIHRDIKPANIMVDIEGNPVVTDFGIAKVANTEGLTMTGAAIGTPFYMSPEQCQTGPLTGSSDQYSLGVMAYEMLTGHLPFQGGNSMTIMFRHVNETPAPILPQAPRCPPDLAAVVERMLLKGPEERFPSMEELVRALAAPVIAHDDPVRTRLIQYAMEGDNRKLLKRVSTPRSPLPTAPLRTPRTPPRQRTAGAAAAVPSAVSRSLPAPRGARRPLLLGGALVTVAVASALLVLKPWQGGPALGAATTADSQVVQLPAQSTPVTIPADTATGVPAVTEPAAVSRLEPAPDTVKLPAPRVQAPPPQRPPAVTSAPVSRIPTTRLVRVSGPTTLNVGDPAVLEASPQDSAGHEVPGRRVDWTSSAPEVVSVNRAGAVVGRQAGRAVITATVDNIPGAITLTVRAPVQVTLSLAPAQMAIDVGETTALRATLEGAAGTAIQWSSANPTVATVDSEGRVTGRAPGATTIAASAAGRQATAGVTVSARGPTEAELRAEVARVIQAYAAALEAKDVAAVRKLYPAMTDRRERELRTSLPNLRNLRVQLAVADVQLSGDLATATVTGAWTFVAGGNHTELPASNVYSLARRGEWVITEIR